MAANVHHPEDGVLVAKILPVRAYVHAGVDIIETESEWARFYCGGGVEGLFEGVGEVVFVEDGIA